MERMYFLNTFFRVQRETDIVEKGLKDKYKELNTLFFAREFRDFDQVLKTHLSRKTFTDEKRKNNKLVEEVSKILAKFNKRQVTVQGGVTSQDELKLKLDLHFAFVKQILYRVMYNLKKTLTSNHIRLSHVLTAQHATNEKGKTQVTLWLQPFAESKEFYLDFMQLLVDQQLTLKEKYLELKNLGI